MKKINKQLNLSINYKENLYNIIWLTKMNTKVYVIFLLNVYKYVDDTKDESFL